MRDSVSRGDLSVAFAALNKLKRSLKHGKEPYVVQLPFQSART